MSHLTGKIIISQDKFERLEKEAKNIHELQKKIGGGLDKKITEFLEIILGGGILLNTSDIHFEPEEKQTKIRFRIDGVLQNISDIKTDLYKNLLSRIKLVSGIKLNITKKPQDGRFTILAAAQTIEIRASALPTEYGETIVLRILNPKKLITIPELGLRKDLFEIFQKQIQLRNGMIVVTGPTGSGKSTTLYGFLKEILNPEIKIITIENPIEYHLKGISQTQISKEKGYTFANGLKSIMRQDPDVILVGEIRDSETCKISIQAALTGHLVLTSLHTNDAAGTVARLISLDAKPCNIGPAINIAVAQRLVRKVCKKCSILKPASPPELKKIKQGLKNIPEKIKPLVLKKGAKIKISKIKGCPNCNFTGYKGRIGIFEAFIIDREIEKFILKNPSTAELRKLAVRKGMLPMAQDGLIKVLKGTTTIEEVERVVGIRT